MGSGHRDDAMLGLIDLRGKVADSLDERTAGEIAARLRGEA